MLRCPDIPAGKRAPGPFPPLRGCRTTWDVCPASYLRGSGDREYPRPEYLIGADHPAAVASAAAFDIESGAVALSALPPKLSDLAMAWIHERDAAREQARKDDEEERKRGQRNR